MEFPERGKGGAWCGEGRGHSGRVTQTSVAVLAPMAIYVYEKSSFPQKNSQLIKGLPFTDLEEIQYIHDSFILAQKMLKIREAPLKYYH